MVLKVGCILKILEWLFGRCWTRLHEQRFLHCTCYPSYIPMHEEIFTCLITLTQYNLDPALLPSSLVQLPLMELPEKATYIKLFLVWTLFLPFNSSSNKKLMMDSAIMFTLLLQPSSYHVMIQLEGYICSVYTYSRMNHQAVSIRWQQRRKDISWICLFYDSSKCKYVDLHAGHEIKGRSDHWLEVVSI